MHLMCFNKQWVKANNHDALLGDDRVSRRVTVDDTIHHRGMVDMWEHANTCS